MSEFLRLRQKTVLVSRVLFRMCHTLNAYHSEKRPYPSRNYKKRQIIISIQEQCLTIPGKNITHKIPYWQK